MKRIAILTCIIIIALSLKSQEEVKIMVTHLKNGDTIETPVLNIDSITFYTYRCVRE